MRSLIDTSYPEVGAKPVGTWYMGMSGLEVRESLMGLRLQSVITKIVAGELRI